MDIRINTTFRDHRKRKRLIRRLGYEGLVALIDLWLFTADNNPSGDLKNYDAEDVADDANWGGDPQEFLDALIDIGFINKYVYGYVLHDWEDHQQWVISAETRRLKAKKAAKARWDNLASNNAPSIAPSNAPSMPVAMPDSDLALLTNLSSNAPNQDSTKTVPIHNQSNTKTVPPPFPPDAPKDIEGGDDSIDDTISMFKHGNPETVYQEYPKKVGKGAAIKSIQKALKKVAFDDLLQKVKEYSIAVNGQDKKYIPNPATWFNQERWEDDQTEWNRKDTQESQPQMQYGGWGEQSQEDLSNVELPEDF